MPKHPPTLEQQSRLASVDVEPRRKLDQVVRDYQEVDGGLRMLVLRSSGSELAACVLYRLAWSSPENENTSLSPANPGVQSTARQARSYPDLPVPMLWAV